MIIQLMVTYDTRLHCGITIKIPFLSCNGPAVQQTVLMHWTHS